MRIVVVALFALVTLGMVAGEGMGQVKKREPRNPFQKYLDGIAKNEERIRKEKSWHKKKKYEKYLEGDKEKLAEALKKRIGKYEKTIAALEEYIPKLDPSDEKDAKKLAKLEPQLEKMRSYVLEQTEFAYPEQKKMRLEAEAKAKAAEEAAKKAAEELKVAQEKGEKEAQIAEGETPLATFADDIGEWKAGEKSVAGYDHSGEFGAVIVDHDTKGVGSLVLKGAPLKDIATIKVSVMVDKMDKWANFGLAVQSSKTSWDDRGWKKLKNTPVWMTYEFKIDPKKHPADIKWANIILRTNADKPLKARIKNVRYIKRAPAPAKKKEAQKPEKKEA